MYIKCNVVATGDDERNLFRCKTNESSHQVAVNSWRNAWMRIKCILLSFDFLCVSVTASPMRLLFVCPLFLSSFDLYSPLTFCLP